MDRTELLDCPLEPTEVERYSRQLLLPQFGVQSQKRLRDGRVLIVGLGGLGCPAALYLAGAGVGTIGLVDRPQDVVEKSNLHRQLAHSEERVGMNKVKSAEIAIRALNSSLCIEKHEEITPANAVELVGNYDVVLDCTDNVMSRYLISDACAAKRIPLVSGSAIGLEGQLTIYCSDAETPCYRCIFPKPPPPNCVGSCDSAGVLGPVPGIIGTMQALETLKLLGQIRRTTSLERKLLLFDAAESTFRSVKLRSRAKNCAVCGDNRSVVVSSFDYQGFALGVNEMKQKPESDPLRLEPRLRLSVQELAALRKSSTNYRLIDVRPETEFEMCHLKEAENLPLGALRLASPFSDDAEQIKTIFICRRGNSSQEAVHLAIKTGASNVFDVIGGLQAWHLNIDQKFPLY